MIKKIIKSPLFWIFVLAFFLRIYKLGSFPVGFHVDEVKVGWNALSILKTGKDDKGNLFALYYNSFGDFRPTGIFYATIPSIIAFGRNEFAVRFPAALLGALTIFPLYFLVLKISKNKKIALVATIILALSPWHISVSRATSEVVISMFIALWGIYYFLKGIDSKNKKDFFLSVSLIILSYFFYHSIRILAPLFIFAIILYRKAFYKKAILSLCVISLATLLLLLNKEARGRFTQVSIFNDLDVQYELSRMPFEEGPGKVFIARMFHNKPLVYTRRFVNEYTKYFSSNFFLDSTTPKPARYQTVGIGLLTYIELALLIFGLIGIAQKKFSFLPLLLLLLAPFAAALTTEDSPNLHRALLMLPMFVIIEAYGFKLLEDLKIKTKLIYLLLSLNFIFFAHMYLIHNRVHLPLYRNVGAKELAVYLSKVQENYDKIILTNIPDSPSPWIAFFTGKALDQKFIVSGQRCPSRDAFEKPDVKRLLVVDAEGCATESNLKERIDVKLINVIKRPDETEVYNIWSRIE